MDESGITQNRRSRRSNVLMAASLESSGAATAVTLRNLSTDGALVEGEGLPIEGTAVLFRKKELRLNGHVAWVQDNRAGIAFDQKLDPDSVLRHIPTPRPRVQYSHRRPGLSAQELTPEDRKFAEAWIVARPLSVPGE